MTIDDFIDFLENDESLGDGEKNVLAEPASEADIAVWDEANPDFPLPKEYKALLLKANGIKIHSSKLTSKGFLSFLPLAKLKPLAEVIMDICGLGEEDLTDPPSCLMV